MKKSFISFICAICTLATLPGASIAYADVSDVYSAPTPAPSADTTARPDQASPGTSASAQPDTAPSDTPISSRSSVVSDNSSDGSSNSNAAGDSGNIPILNSFDGTNTDGTLNPNQTSANLAENNSKYNGMSTVPIPGAAKSRYSNTRVALSPDIADTKYEEAAELLGALGIMVGDAEDGAFRPNDNILRSEMAKVAVYTVGLEDVVKSSTSPTKFPDVATDHWAVGAINVADQQGMVIGDTEGTFRPDDDVSLQEAVTIIVRALGYEPAAEDKGGYPSGYMTIASSKQLLRGIDASIAEPAKRGDVAQLVFNALTVNMMEQVGYGTEVSYEEVDKTLLYDRLNVEKGYGQITGTGETTLSGGATPADDRIQIGENQFFLGDTNAKQLLGYNVLYYARIDKNQDRRTLINVREQENQNQTKRINSSDLVDVTGETDQNKTVEYWENKTTDRTTRTATIDSNATYIYNGKYKDDLNLSDLIPESGNLILLDTDMNNIYDIVFVNHFTNLVVDTVSTVTGRVTDKYLNGSVVFDPNNTELKYSIIKDDAEIGIEDLAEWNVISYTISEDQLLIKAYVSDASVTGTVSEVTSEGYRIGDSDTLYEKASSYPNEIALRDRGTFYLDIENKIAAVNTNATVEGTTNMPNYAYLVGAAIEDNFGTTARFKLFTKTGETVVLSSASKLRLNDNYSQTPETVVDALSSAGTVVPQLIIYETNSSNEVTAIETAFNGTGTGAPNTERFTLNISQDNLVYRKNAGKLGNAGIDSNTIIFDIPASAGTDTDKYSIRKNSTLSNNAEYNAQIYDMQANYMANVVVITSSTGFTSPEDPITVVNYLASVQNEDMEYTDKLYGYQNGEPVELLASDTNVLVKDTSEKLKSGDIIQYTTNARGEIDNIRVLFDSSDMDTEFINEIETDLTTVYGKVTRKFSGSVNMNVNDVAYNYAIGSDTIVYLYDSSKSRNNVSIVSPADIEIYEEGNEARLFVKLYEDGVQEMVIVR